MNARSAQTFIVGNISAGSWGPGNLLAYARRFGLFDADVVVLVLNSLDASDNPSGRPIVGIDPSYPDAAPAFALAEAFERYVLPRICKRSQEPAVQSRPQAAKVARETGVRDLATLCDVIEATGAALVIIHWPNRVELTEGMLDGYLDIRSLAASREIPFIELSHALRTAIDGGKDPYRRGDLIHPNTIRQDILSQELLPLIERLLGLQGLTQAPLSPTP